jgi:hypothetical protein
LFALKKLKTNNDSPMLIATIPLIVGGTWSATKDSEAQMN